MRALSATVGFLLTSLGFCALARARAPLLGPRASLTLALDGNQVAIRVPRLTVTAAAPAPAELELAAYNRVESWARDVLIPHYAQPDVDHKQLFRQLYLSPYAPYLGAYGLIVTFETDALLR